MSASLGIIGGSGLNQLPDLKLPERLDIDTPYGTPSAPLLRGHWQGQPLVFLPRHGEGHTLPPHAVNYRANIWALREAGVQDLIGVAAVGGISRNMTPGSIVIPDQLIDYSWGRAHSFHDGGGSSLEHIEFEQPYTDHLRSRLITITQEQGISCNTSGCYGCTQGPRLETAAEIQRMKNDGCDLVGMTGMPEAGLAREAGLNYACVAVVVNWAAGMGTTGQGIHDQIEQAMQQGMDKALALLRLLAAAYSQDSTP